MKSISALRQYGSQKPNAKNDAISATAMRPSRPGQPFTQSRRSNAFGLCASFVGNARELDCNQASPCACPGQAGIGFPKRTCAAQDLPPGEPVSQSLRAEKSVKCP